MKMVLISRLRLRAKLINQNKRGLVRRIPTKHGLLHSLGGETWTMYTTAGQRLAAGTDAGSNFKAYTMLNHDDDPSNAYAAIKMIEGENVNSFVNLYYGQSIGNEYGPWSDGDNGSKVYFVEASEIELHSWDFDFKIFDKKNNATRYFIQFNSPAANNPSYGPTGLGGRTGKNLVLSVDNDTLISDSVIVADANFNPSLTGKIIFHKFSRCFV